MGDCVPINSGQIWGEGLPLIPEKVYDLGFIDYSTMLMMGKSPKLVMRFNVVEQGEYFGIVLSKYYGLKKLTTKPKKSGGFYAGRLSDFLRDYFTFFPDQFISRVDRIPMTRFKNVIVQGRVKTVTKGYNQRNIPDQLQYSVIGELLYLKDI